jgi:hypothetical protein
VRKEHIRPINPDKFVWLEVQNSSPSREGGAVTTRGLRDATDQNYQWFCEHFLECVIPSSEWKLHARKKRLSVYITPTLEAFAVLVYKNAFTKWEVEFQLNDEDDGTETSSLTTSSSNHRFLYTGDSKGSRKYEGWNAEGMRLYNDLVDLITQQCGRAGCTFERDLLKKISGKPRVGRKSQDANQAPRVKNNVDQLMQMIGV